MIHDARPPRRVLPASDGRRGSSDQDGPQPSKGEREMIGMDMSPEDMRAAVMTAYAAGKLPERVRFEISTAAEYARDVLSQEDTTSHRAALAMVTQSLEWLSIAQDTADHMFEPCDQDDPAACPVHALWDQVNAREYGAGVVSAES